MALSDCETGTLPGGLSYVRAGDGPRTLVVLPGVEDAMFSGRYPLAAAPALRRYFASVADDRAVYLLGRPRGLPDDYTARDGARTHATAIADELGSTDVLGVSLGGLLAQELAKARPDLVDRLVVVSSGCRLPESGREEARRLRRLATRHDWAGVRAALVRAMFSGWRRYAYPPWLVSVGRGLLPRPAVPSDVWNSIDAALAYDGTDTLGDVDPPTLVFGGEDDPYFPAPILRETAAGIPESSLTVVPGAKHGAFHERKRAFDDRLAAFLEA